MVFIISLYNYKTVTFRGFHIHYFPSALSLFVILSSCSFLPNS